MTEDKTSRQNRVRQALGRIYDQEPPHFREYLRRFREDPESRVFAPLAEAYRRLGRVDEAIQLCHEGLEKHPTFHGARVTLAKCFVDRHKYSEALEELQRVVQSIPENLLAQKLLGDVYEQLEDREQALHCYKVAQLLAPEDLEITEKLRLLLRPLSTKMNISATAKTQEMEQPTPPLPNNKEKIELESQSIGSVVATSVVEEEKLNEPPPLPSAPEVSQRKNNLWNDELPIEEVSALDKLLGYGPEDERAESFSAQSIATLFHGDEVKSDEITTETLADLYYSQGQYERALRIFERLNLSHPRIELAKKVESCRKQLGVDSVSLERQRKITMLRDVLKKMRPTA